MTKKLYNQRELFRFQNFSELKTDYFYVLLGTLNEYMGGYANPLDRIDYYIEDEKEVVKLIHKICLTIISEFNLENDCELIQTDETLYIESKSIKSKLNAFFNSKLDDFLIHKRYSSTNYNEMNYEQKWSYLLGVYIREFQGEQFRFANAKPKVTRVHNILCESSTWDDDKVIMTSFFGTPHITTIQLNKEHEVLKELDKSLLRIKTNEQTNCS